MSLTYYLTIDGVIGDVTAEDHEGSFLISDYSFDVSAFLTSVAGSGDTTVHKTFPPLMVDLDINSGLTALLKDIASGKFISSIELTGVATDGQTVYDLKLGNVVMTRYHDTNSGHDSLSFDYETVSLTTTPQNPDGSLGTPVTVRWDVEHDKERRVDPRSAPEPPANRSRRCRHRHHRHWRHRFRQCAWQ